MMKSVSRRARWIAITGGLVAVAVTAGVLQAWGSFAASTSTPVTYNHNTVLVPRAQVGTTPASLLSEIVAHVGSASVVSANLAGPPPDVRESDDPSVANSPAFDNSLWLYVTVKAASLTPEATTRPIWLGNIITGALRDELFLGSQPPLYSSLVSVDLPDGSQATDVGGGIGAIQPGQEFLSASDSSIRSRLTSAARTVGDSIDSIDIVRADQPAPAVVVTTSNPQAAAANPDGLLNQLFGAPGTYEGEYLEVRAEDGTPVFVQASAFRTGVGQRWVNPLYGGTATSQPPGG